MTEKKEKEEKEEKKEKEEREESVKVPEKFKKLVEEIENLSVLELSELVKILEKKFGVTAVPTFGTIQQSPVLTDTPSSASSPTDQEKSVFNIELKEVGDRKIEVIKVVRDVTGKGLKESKDLVDAIASGPQIIRENVKKEEAEEIKKKFESAGAKIELK